MSKDPSKPNIVLILADNLGWGELGCYGGGSLRGAATPRIDKLATEGLPLRNFNVESDSVPTRSALMTSRHPIRTGCRQSVPAGFPTVASVGTLLQVGVLAFAAVMTYCLQWEKEGNRLPSYTCPLTIIGTVYYFVAFSTARISLGSILGRDP
ncbi:arylsulfatase A [Fusarium pseudocircinatum]|uniref:Arylsulfatase A n=1 Tax=Fusarium pseudocircinatum TaxID=56676 RepID=A0A8H5PK20_9HYPO|nr:arylsulfatase A [Fusarium pseudocircinatum]